MESLLLF